MNRFQVISCLISKELLWVKDTNFLNQRPYRSVQNEQILRIFKEITCLILIRFQRRYILLVKNCNFFNQMLYRSVLLHENFQYFGPNHDILQRPLMLQINKIAYLLISWKSIPQALDLMHQIQ